MGAVWAVWGRLFWLEWGLVGVGSYRRALLEGSWDGLGGMEESAFASDEFMQGTGFVQNCLHVSISSAKHVLS